MEDNVENNKTKADTRYHLPESSGVRFVTSGYIQGVITNCYATNKKLYLYK